MRRRSAATPGSRLTTWGAMTWRPACTLPSLAGTATFMAHSWAWTSPRTATPMHAATPVDTSTAMDTSTAACATTSSWATSARGTAPRTAQASTCTSTWAATAATTCTATSPHATTA